jgi:putative tryptophan/tyrosine transport system substrate-binding protein
MDRRAFVTMVVGSFLAAPLAAGAQSTRAARIGYLGNGSATGGREYLDAFRQGLRELGWIEGQTVTIEYRWADGHRDRLPALAADLVRLKVDIIIVAGTPAIRAAKAATNMLPIVFVYLADPVTAGFVPSLAHPGENITGVASEFEALITKQLQLLKEAVPNVSQVALLHPGTTPSILGAAQTAARSLGLTARAHKVTDAAEFENVFRTVRSENVGAIQVLPSPFFDGHRRQLIELAARYRLPAVYEFKNYVQDGGFMSYGPSINEMFRRAAGHIDRILKGAKPGDLPIERPTTFELVINLRTAKAIGLTVPESLLGRADEIIQ